MTDEEIKHLHRVADIWAVAYITMIVVVLVTIAFTSGAAIAVSVGVLIGTGIRYSVLSTRAWEATLDHAEAHGVPTLKHKHYHRKEK